MVIKAKRNKNNDFTLKESLINLYLNNWRLMQEVIPIANTTLNINIAK